MRKSLSTLPVLTAALMAALISAACVLSACNSSESEGDKESFAVKFALASVPSGITLDSLEVGIALGDTGEPQALTIDLKTGTSKTQVLAYPGQTYSLTYVLYASGFDIGRGRDSGTLAKDMAIDLQPVWDLGKIASALATREQGKLLPAHLEGAFGLVVAGKPLIIALDSSKSLEYTWYVRMGDSVIASGEGARLSWTPDDSLGGKSVNVKLVVKQGDKVLEERDWDVKVLGLLPVDWLQGVITRTDTLDGYGSFTLYKYNAEGGIDSVLTFDTTALVAGRQPVHTLAYTYTKDYHPTGDVFKVVRTARNESEIDSLFAYDDEGRLAAVTVAIQSGNTADSLAYAADGTVEIRSFAQGKLMRRVKQVSLSENAGVDSVWSRGDSGLVLSGLIRNELSSGKVVSKRVFSMFAVLEPIASEWTLYNALGSVALRRYFREGDELSLQESETFTYRSSGLLDRRLHKDEETGDLIRVQTFLYQSSRVPKTAVRWAGNALETGPRAAASKRMALLDGLAQINRHFPIRGHAGP